LKQWRAHGGGGASNSEARRKVLEWQIVGVGRRELQRKWEVFFLGEHVVEKDEGRLC